MAFELKSTISVGKSITTHSREEDLQQIDLQVQSQYNLYGR